MKNKLLRTLLPALLAVVIIASGLWIPQQVLAYRKTLLLKSAGSVQADALTIFDGGEVSARLLEDRISKLSELIREYKDGGYSDAVLSADTREPLDTELNQENAIEAAQLLQAQFYQKITTWRNTPGDSTTQQSNGEGPTAVDAVEFLVSPSDVSLSLWYADTGACRMAFDALSGVPIYFAVNLESAIPAESSFLAPEIFSLMASEIYNAYQADQYFTFPLAVTTVSPVVSPVDGSKEYTYEFTSAQYLLSVSVSQGADGTFTGMEGWLSVT